MEATLGLAELEKEMAELEDRGPDPAHRPHGARPRRRLHGRPLREGRALPASLEETFGRERFDKFLRGYFDHFAFQSITTADFVAVPEQEPARSATRSSRRRSRRGVDREAGHARERAEAARRLSREWRRRRKRG